MKILLIDQESEEFDTEEIASILNEKHLQQKLTQMNKD